MMDTSNFLARVWGADEAGNLANVHFIAVPAGKVFQHYPVKTVEQAAVLSRDLSGLGKNVYFACSEFRTSQNRKQSNAMGARSLWLDVDCGPEKAAENKGYRSKGEAITALASFCKSAGLPLPTITVDSGNGAHVYWIFPELIHAENWLHAACGLKSVAAGLGFRTDPNRTADLASVLRVPGTQNLKDPQNPKPVKIRYVRNA